MGGTVQNRQFEVRVIHWLRCTKGLTTRTRPEDDLGNRSGRGVVWAWEIQHGRGGRLLFTGGVIILGAALAYMLGERLHLGTVANWIGGASVFIGTALGIIGNRLFAHDKHYVAVAYVGGRQAGESTVWELGDTIQSESKTDRRRADHERWILAEHGFSRRGLVAAGRLGFTCFTAEGKGFRQLDFVRPIPPAANDAHGEEPPRRPPNARRVA